MNHDNEQYNDGYEDNPENMDGVEVMDRWFASDQWQQVLQQADDGCQDSVDLMETINGHLTSLIFHMRNGSGPVRVMYELNYFNQLCDDFNVA